MRNRKDRLLYIMVAVFMVGLALTMMVPVFAAPGDNITGKSLTVSGPGDGTRPGGPAGGPWGTMQIIDTSGLNAYYASIGDATHCTWEFHPGNDVNNGWSFGALSKDSGSDLEIMRKVGGDWKPIDLLVDFDSGRVGIGTTSPMAKLHVVTNDATTGASAIFAQETAGADTAAVIGRYGTAGSGTRGLLGGTNVGVYGVNETANNHGFMGGSDYGVKGESSSGNFGYLGQGSYGVHGVAGSGNYAGYFEGKVNITDNLTVGNNSDFTGIIRAPKIAYAAPRTHKFSVPAASFTPQNSGLGYGKVMGTGGAYITDSSGYMYAPVYLPDGAVVTQFTGYFYDNSGSDLSISLRRQELIAFNTTMASVDSSGTPLYNSENTTSITDPTINNNGYAYFVEAYWATGNGANLEVMGAVITYTISEAE